jgi:hypothetical protein
MLLKYHLDGRAFEITAGCSLNSGLQKVKFDLRHRFEAESRAG